MRIKLNQFVAVLNPYSSIRQNVLGVSKELVSLGNEVTIYTTYSNQKNLFCEEKVTDGIVIKRFPAIIKLKKFRFSPKLLRYIKKIDGDILHSHDCRGFETIAAICLRKSKMLPLVLSTYGSVPYVYSFGDKFFKILQDILTFRAPLRSADMVLAETESEKKDLMNFGVPEEKIRIIYGRVDVGLFKKKQANFFETDSQIILYVGRINRIKGIDFLIRAFCVVAENHDEAKLMIVGSPEDPSYLKELKLLARTLRISDKVVFYGPVPYKQLPKVYSSADLLVLPSVWENMGNVLLEAQSCECPVIASNIAGTREVMVHEKTGFLVALGDLQELAGRISLLLNDEKMRHSMGKNAREFVSQRFSLNAYTKRILNVYSELVQ